MEQFKFANKSEQIKKINKYMSTSMILFDALIMLVVVISVNHGNRTLPYAITIASVMVATLLACLVMVKINPCSRKMKYVAFVGMFVVSLMIAFVYDDYYMRFMTTVPFFGSVFYFNKKYSVLCANGIAIPNIVIFLYRAFVVNDYREGEMLAQLGATIVVAVVMYVLQYLTMVGSRFNDDSIGRIRQESELQQAMVLDIMDIATEVRNSTEQAMNLVDSLKASSGGVKHSVAEISSSTVITAQSMQEQNTMTQNIQKNIEDTTMRAEHMVKVAKESGELNRENVKKMKELKVHADMLADTNEKVAESMKLLQSNVGDVRNITKTIFDISSQTNLLALNASIEAARAGEAGRGFAVVADQIRNLAEETKVSTEQITAIITELTSITQETQKGIEESVESINVQRQKVEEVNESFSLIEEGMTELGAGVGIMNDEVGEVLEANKVIVESIDLLSSASEEVSAETQNSKSNIDTAFKSLNLFCETFQGTFEELENLKQTACV